MHSFPFLHMAPLVIFTFFSLLNVFLARFPGRDFSVTSWFVASLNFVLFFSFVKIFPRPFAELSPVIVLFFLFVCCCLSYVFECFTVSTSSMALFAQHQSLLFFFYLFLWVCEIFQFSYSTVTFVLFTVFFYCS